MELNEYQINQLDVYDFIFDFETLAATPDAAVVDMAILVFNNNPYKVPTFSELVSQGMRLKFNISSQKGHRRFDPDTIEWWKTQSESARKNLVPLDTDIQVEEMFQKVVDFLHEKGFNKRTGQGWCRGLSFDFPIMYDIIRKQHNVHSMLGLEPCNFWNQRDIRTAIEATLMIRGKTNVPLPNGVLDGFVKHDSIHDCAADVLQLLYAKRYAMGLEEFTE